MTSITVAIIGFLGSVLAVVIANRYTAHAARKAAVSTARLEERKLDAETWREQYQAWKDDALKLRKLRDEDQARYEVDRQRLEDKLAECGAKIATMEATLTLLTRERAQEQVYLDSLVAWCRIVITLLRQAGVSFPPAPAGVTALPDASGG